MMMMTNPIYRLETPRSSAIGFVAYSPIEQILTIAFKRKGGLAAYGYRTRRHTYMSLRDVHAKGGSIGKAFHRYVKGTTHSWKKLV